VGLAHVRSDAQRRFVESEMPPALAAESARGSNEHIASTKRHKDA